MKSICVFDFDEEKMCIDMDKVRTIVLKKSKIIVKFKEPNNFLEIEESEDTSKMRAKDLFDSLTKAWAI